MLDKLAQWVFGIPSPTIDEIIKEPLHEHKFSWPECPPPKEGNQEDMVLGFTVYTKSEVSPGKWHWVESSGSKAIRALDEEKRRLLWALRSRLLTAEEMDKVNSYGDTLNIYYWESYKQKEKTAELNAALLNQFRMRSMQGDSNGVAERMVSAASSED